MVVKYYRFLQSLRTLIRNLAPSSLGYHYLKHLIMANNSLLQISQLYLARLSYFKKYTIGCSISSLLYQNRMPLVIQLDKLASTTLFQFRLKYQSIGAVVNITFRQAKAFLYSLLKIKALFFWVKTIRGKTRVERLLINRQ